MQLRKPSQTTLAAAFHRAAHQVVERGRIFADPLALPILGVDAQTIARQAGENPSGRRMRLFIAVRTRFAEDALAAAFESGVRQVVVLGAGLDTYAYRSPLRDRLRILEVDHPATQAWKRQRLRDAAIPLPSSLAFVPVDFERETLADRLAAAGFDRTQQTFFTWLGVVPYLNQEAVWSTLAFIASPPNGAHVVFDYSDPPASLSPESRASHERRARLLAGLGEAWVTYFEPEKLHAKLAALGFAEIENLGPAQIASRYFPSRAGSLPDRGGHVIRARTKGSEVEELRSQGVEL
jgi:methyltransferase (TIGR00027 family)